MESAVTGFGAQNIDQELVVFVQLSAMRYTEDEHDVLQEVVSRTGTQLTSFEQPRFVMVVQGFAKTPSERIEKHKLPIDNVVACAWARRVTKSQPKDGPYDHTLQTSPCSPMLCCTYFKIINFVMGL